MSKALEDYLSKVTSAHNKPKFMAVLSMALQPFIDAQKFLEELPLHFDIDVAIGAQLDVVGKWIGRSRYIDAPIPDPWFAFDTAGRGWDQGVWKGPYDLGSLLDRLGDDLYRKLLYAKRSANHWDGTVPSAEAIFRLLIDEAGTKIWLEDRFDMSEAICIAQMLPPLILLFMVEQGLLPTKPAGVGRLYHFVSVDGAPLFGFDSQNENVAGWDTGAWGVGASWLLNNPT